MDPSRRDVCLAAGLGIGAGLALVVSTGAEKTSAHLRPPGAGTEAEFLAACIRCSLCVTACTYDTLHLVDLSAGLAAGTPAFDARANPCRLCSDHRTLLCIEACPTGALRDVEIEDIRIGVARIDRETCLAHQGITCRVCWHACPFPDAALRYDKRLRPEIDADRCIGCGLCEHTCLVEPSAIVIEPGAATR